MLLQWVDSRDEQLLKIMRKKQMEMRGIEPLASRMRIERSTTELHPHRLAVVVCLIRDTIMRARLAEWSKA